MEIITIKRKQSRKKIKKDNKVMRISIISFAISIVIYFGMSLYYSTHFYSGFVFNGIKASGKTVEQLDKALIYKCKTYTLELNEETV